jgi:hypothetical protein
MSLSGQASSLFQTKVKLLRFLQYYPPPAGPVLSERLTEVLRKILSREGLSATHDASNKSNADFAILFEARASPRSRAPRVSRAALDHASPTRAMTG